MSMLIVWSAVGLSLQEAARRFAEVLSTQRQLYGQAFGRDFPTKAARIGNIWIGQLQFETGVQGWTPWAETGQVGLAWSGICEEFLGVALDTARVEQIVSSIGVRPQQLRDWDGRFGLCTWDLREDTVRLTTGATENRSFWHAEGPDGWAIGTRALPLLNLVGRQPQIDLDSARLYALHGYLVGGRHLLNGVTRILSRRQAVSVGGVRPIVSTYLGLDEYLSLGEPALGWEAAVRLSAERLQARSVRQLAHSRNPALLLTGGRDSRCIAAAVTRAGYSGVAQTSGAPGSDDMRISALVARALGLTHKAVSAEEDRRSLAAIVEAPERLQLWMQLSEGLETIRHAVAYPDFFLKHLPFPTTITPLFHGLGGEIGRGYYYPRDQNIHAVVDAATACAAIVGRGRAGVRGSAESDELLLEEFEAIKGDVGGRQLTLAQWLDLFYWQNRCLHWGEDMMSVKEPTGWRWAPLFDRVLICAAWGLPPERKAANRFIEDVTVALQPVLASIPYDKQPLVGLKARLKLVKQTVKHIVRRSPLLKPFLPPDRSKKYVVDEHLERLWDDSFGRVGSQVWPALMDGATLDEWRQTPSAEVLWNLATIELAARYSTAPAVEEEQRRMVGGYEGNS